MRNPILFHFDLAFEWGSSNGRNRRTITGPNYHHMVSKAIPIYNAIISVVVSNHLEETPSEMVFGSASITDHKSQCPNVLGASRITDLHQSNKPFFYCIILSPSAESASRFSAPSSPSRRMPLSSEPKTRFYHYSVYIQPQLLPSSSSHGGIKELLAFSP